MNHLPFLPYFKKNLYSSSASILSKAHSFLFITFPFIYLLTFMKTAQEIKFLYPSFFLSYVDSNEIFHHNSFFQQILLFLKNTYN